jgi:hypothetical protein
MKLLNFIICDDIRNELGNKRSLMGIYDDSIEFQVTPDNQNTWPKSLRVGIYAKVKTEDNEKVFKFKIRMKYNEKETVLVDSVLTQPKIKPFSKIVISLVNGAFKFENPGKITFFLDFYNQKKELIDTLSPEFVISVKEKVIQ